MSKDKELSAESKEKNKRLRNYLEWGMILALYGLFALILYLRSLDIL